MKIALDIMGSDQNYNVAIDGAINFCLDNKDCEIILVGDEQKARQYLKSKKLEDKFQYFNTTEVIEMTDGILDIRRKTDSSMVKSLELLKENKVDGLVTAGATAPYIAASHFILGEIEGIKKPGFMPIIPTIEENKIKSLLDVGANLENSPQDLLNFAKMATIYQKEILNIENPRVGLLNIGTEDHKGLDMHKQAYKFLKEDKTINFIGNVEGFSILKSDSDIIISDGYSGNIMLKTMEGSVKSTVEIFKNSFKKKLIRKIGTLFLLGAFKDIRKKLDVRNYSGAILLGVNGIAFKAHGSSDAVGFYATLNMVKTAIKKDVLNKIKTSFNKDLN